MFDGTPYRNEFCRRIDTVRRMLDVADPPGLPETGAYIGREIRGLVILLLFASYENLLKSLCRGLLQTAVSLRVGNRRLRTGFRIFAVFDVIRAVLASEEKEKHIWKKAGGDLLELAADPKKCTINPYIFPHDGSFMKRSQVTLFFRIFNLGDPASILQDIWEKLDTIVVQRNKIAHGEMTPEEVGRTYSSEDVRALVNAWERRWMEFILHIEEKASLREFYRNKRA